MHELRSTILSGEPKPTLVTRKAKTKAEAPIAGGLTKIAIKRQEARVTDQRLEDRLRGVVETGTIIFRRRRRDAAVVNVSSRGAMIRSEIEPRIGEKIDLLFDGKNRTKCIVRWVRENRIGLEFVDETIFWTSDRSSGPGFQPDKAESEAALHVVAERESRHKLLRAGTLYWSGISIPVRLRNISGGGARVESGRELCPGSEVELDLGEAGFQIAEVRWSKDGQIGLRFAEEFDIESLAPSNQAERPPELLKPAYLETELQADSPWAARFEKLTLTDLKSVGPKG